MDIASPKFVAPIPAELRDRLRLASRLYAYPKQPEPPVENEFCILDSGAYGLAKSGGTMSKDWIENLAKHYKKYNATDKMPIVGIAPDVSGSPEQTIANYKWWRKNIQQPIAPVIQRRKKNHFSLYTIVKQAEYYSQFNPEFIAMSNPCGWGKNGKGEMNIAIHKIKEITGAKWVHVFGAGWTNTDVSAWLENGVDSIDSIAYYTSAQEGKLWRDGGDEQAVVPHVNWYLIALKNHACIQRRVAEYKGRRENVARK